MRILTIIPARAGSTRIPCKNLQRVGGKTLLRHAIDVAMWPLVVSVTGDADTIMECGSAGLDWNGNEGAIHVRRCGPDGPMYNVVMDVLERQRARGLKYDAITLLQPTSPLRTLELVRAVERARHDGCAVSVGPDGKRDGLAYCVTVAHLWESRALWCDLAVQVVTPAERSIDINTPEDLERAEAMWQALNGSSTRS